MSHSLGTPVRGTLAALAAASLLASCVTPPRSQSRAAPATGSISVPGQLAGGEVVRPEPPPQWWRLYREPALDALVEEALHNNRDLRAAAAHLLQAQAIVQEARGALWPTTGLAAGAGDGSTIQDQIAAAQDNRGTQSIRTGPRFDLGAEVSWELDLFGRLRATLSATQADARASAALEDGVRIAVAAGVTGAWLNACGSAHRVDVARQSQALAQRGRELAERLALAGSGLPVDVLRAQVLVAQADAALPMLVAQRHDALAELAVLTARPPEDIPPAAAACTQLPTLPAAVPIGDPKALFRRRPDVRAAEERLAARTARIGVAVADLYPRISLGSEAAVSSPTLAGLGQQANLVWRVGPLLSWSFPNFSAARARVRYARAGQAAALADFDAALLAALREVNQKAADGDAAIHRQQALRAAAELAARADRLVQIQRAAGATTALAALEAERADIEAQAALAAADSDVASTQVALFKALGAGAMQAPAVSLPTAAAGLPAASSK